MSRRRHNEIEKGTKQRIPGAPETCRRFSGKKQDQRQVLLGSSLNLDGPLSGHRFTLRIGSHRNKALQESWNEYGPDNFIFEILETVQVKNDPNFSLSDELTLLEMIWLEKLEPFGEKGYNTSTRIRQA